MNKHVTKAGRVREWVVSALMVLAGILIMGIPLAASLRALGWWLW